MGAFPLAQQRKTINERGYVLNNGILEFVNVGKEYSGHAVLKGINMDVRPGEIHALIGENGAGKSTLMNILFGMPVIHSTGGFTGEVRIGGEDAKIMNPHDAMMQGIGMVHQEFMLIPGFTITENIKINREITKSSLMSKVFGKRMESLEHAAMATDARKALDTMGMDIEEYTKVHGLPVGHMQFVEIAREIDKTGIRFLVFDEPTAVLTESETEHLLNAIRKLAAQGIGIVFISHRLDEIIRLSDRVTILRDGEWVATEETKNITAAEIARLMVGRALTLDRAEGDRKVSDEKIMTVDNLRVNMPGEEVKGVTFDVHRGEILGIGGLAGQGKLGIANGLMGMYPVTGKVTFKGEPLDVMKTNETLKKGVAFLSEDRKGVGLLLQSSIEENIAFTAMEVHNKFLKKVGPFTLTDDKAIRENAEKMVKDLDIRCTSVTQNTGALSGGNQQKVCVGKALSLDPELLLVSEPTRGIDIGAKKLILDLLKDLAEKRGMTVIMTSSELAELRSICDRVLIICEGKVAGELSPFDSDEVYGLMMSGVSKEEAMKAAGAAQKKAGGEANG
ncbi:MAG: sugar ABC transporter ATP-binding protein [Lachnospiraceae bacterium]|nr:sugar ABC transporter ATP-binding protein [Lachnospiraceae bacterium]